MRFSIVFILAALACVGPFRPQAMGSPRSYTYGQQVVAAVLMGEAWGEGTQAMTAVAEVIRLRADRAGISPLAAVLRPKQFTPLNGTTPEALIRKYHGESDFRLALEIARRMYNQPESLPGYSRGATHFERVGNRAYWTKGHRPVAVVGRLAFYRLSG